MELAGGCLCTSVFVSVCVCVFSVEKVTGLSLGGRFPMVRQTVIIGSTLSHV